MSRSICSVRASSRSWTDWAGSHRMLHSSVTASCGCLRADGHGDSPNLSAAIKLDEAALGFLLGHEWLDSRIAPYCRLLPALSAPTSSGSAKRGSNRGDLPAGPRSRGGPGRGSPARRRSEHPGVRHSNRSLWASADWDSLLGRRVSNRRARRARVADAAGRPPARRRAEGQARAAPATSDGATATTSIFSGSARWESANQQTIVGHSTERHLAASEEWPRSGGRSSIATGPRPSRAVLTRLAATFESLTAGQIGAAVVHAIRTSERAASGPLGAEPLLEGARRQTRGALRGLAERVQIAPTWDDLVLPADTIAQLREIPLRVVHRATVMDDWGFAGKRAYGRGTAVLFSGSSGTGKTLAAAVLAAELGQDLFRIDLAAVVSKYIGETEKNLSRVFDAAERADCILLFDEADALFGKRSDVRDAHDRYANQEVAYLLQRTDAVRRPGDPDHQPGGVHRRSLLPSPRDDRPLQHAR